MAGELPRPGVEVIQTFKATAPSFVRPTLVPCVVGPAFEVINVLNDDASLNSKARFGTYSQLALGITESAFPDPRSNIDELDILESTIRPFMLAGGKLSEMLMAPGQAFLAVGASSSRAAIRTTAFNGTTGKALNGLVLVLAIDQPAPLDRTRDVTVIFKGSENLEAQEVADQINAAVGMDVASVVGTVPNDLVQIASPTYGALSSVTVRSGGSANSVLGIGYFGGSPNHEERVEGAGFRGQDDANNDTKTPWIEFFPGAKLRDSAAVSMENAGFLSSDDDSWETALASEVFFNDNGVPLKAGDFFFADGVRVASGEVVKVEAQRFKIGTVNPTLSTADENGNYIAKVYDIQQVNTLLDGAPFAPRYSYFRAAGLDWRKLAPTAATITGAATVDGTAVKAASVASVKGAGIVGNTIAVTGLKLHYVVTIDGVETEGTFTFTKSYDYVPEVPAVKASFTPASLGTKLEAFAAGASGNNFKVRMADDQTLPGLPTFTVDGVDANLLVIKYKADTHTVLQVETEINDAGLGVRVGTASLTPEKVLTAEDAFLSTDLTGGADLVAEVPAVSVLATDINNSDPIPGVVFSAGAGTPKELVISTLKTGRLQNVVVKSDGTANAALGFSASADTDASTGSTPGADVTYVGLTGEQLRFSLDKNPHVYSVNFSSDSLDLAVDEINAAVGALVASKAGTGGDALAKLKLTSTLKGLASDIEVLDGEATTLFKLDGAVTAGVGRPLPDAYLDDALVLHIQSQILRDLVTGYPLDQSYNSGTLYVQFKALRKDVSAAAKVAGVLRLSDVTTLSAVLDPLTEENPLGLGLFLAMANAPTLEVKGLGIDEVTAAAPEGTGAAYARAAGLLEAEEVYAIAPLTQDEVIQSLWWTHCDVMSEPEQGGERIVFINRTMPSRKNPGIALSGSQANTTSNLNEVLLDSDPTAGLLALGIRGPAIAEDKQVYLEIEVGGDLRHYSVESVSGALVNVRTSFTDADLNADGFYSTTDISVPVVNSPFSLKVRGESLIVPGSNPERLDYGLVSETVAAANSTIHNRRCYSVFPDTVKTTIKGVEKSLPGYYACAAISGMVASKPPQQGFTNYPMAGLTGVVGTEKFSKRQLNVMAGGGTYILCQDAIGAPVTCRHQLSTNVDSIEERELSITKVVDFTAKFLRMAVRKFIGINTINVGLLDSLGTTVHAVLKFLEESGVLNGSNINNIMQDSVNKDTVLIDVTLDVPYPCNYLRLTLVV